MKRTSWILSLVALLLVFPVASCKKDQAPAEPQPAVSAVQATETAAAPAAQTPQPQADPSNPCNTGPVNNPNQPILCVDDTAFPTITLNPTTDTHVNANRTVHWFTKSGTGTIGILYDSDLLDAADAKPGKGHTKAQAKSQAGSVKYSVVVQRGSAVSNVIDPTIIIDPIVQEPR